MSQNSRAEDVQRGRDAWIAILGFLLGAVLAAVFTHLPAASADWAAWVQAIGSVLAIWASARMVKWQLDKERELQSTEARNKFLQRVDLLSKVAAEVEGHIRQLAENIGTDDDARRYLHHSFDANRLTVAQ